MDGRVPDLKSQILIVINAQEFIYLEDISFIK